MSREHPIIAITGSSGAGTTSVMHTFQEIFEREGVHAACVEGDSFHRFSRSEMEAQTERQIHLGNSSFSHFGPDANLFPELQALFSSYARSGQGQTRKYLHSDEEAAEYSLPVGSFTPWEPLPEGSDLLFYEGLHGAVKTDTVDIAAFVDLLIGVVPVINLEWIQKILRDKFLRGYSTEAIADTLVRRMPDYVHYIAPQFSRTHVNFQRVPLVDTSNPFVARHIPSPDESLLVIRFADPRGVDFPYLLSMIDDAFMSRANTIVCPGGKMDLAMQLIFTPMVWQLMDRKRTEVLVTGDSGRASEHPVELRQVATDTGGG